MKLQKSTFIVAIIYFNIFNLFFQSAIANNNQSASANTTESLLKNTETMIEQLLLQIESDKNNSIKSTQETIPPRKNRSRKKLTKTKQLNTIPFGTSPIIASQIRANKISLGMTTKHVILSWGKPQNINRSIGRWGVHEQWVYSNRYLYFENGILTSLQTSD